jgi:hypothetical protein
MKDLFTEYTKQETEFILSLADFKADEIKSEFNITSIPLFKNCNVDEVLDYYEIKKVSKREVINEYDYVWVIKGSLGVIQNGKIVKKVKNSLFGLMKGFFGINYSLIAIEESEVLFFNIKSDEQILLNITEFLLNELKNYTVI